MLELPLGEALETLIDHRGKTPRKLGGDFSAIGTPVISALLVHDGIIDFDSARHISSEIYDRWMPVPTRENDVVLTSEAPLGRVGLITTSAPVALGQRVFGLRGKEGLLDSRYLYYALQTEEMQRELTSRASGTTVTGIRQSELVKVRISIPPIEDQRRAAILLGSLDDKIANCARIVNKLREIGNEVIKSALPHATSSTIRDLAAGGTLSFGDGYRTKRSEHGLPGLPILRVAEVQSGYITPTFTEHVSLDFSRAMGEKTSRTDDVVVTTKGTVGRVALIAATHPEFVYSPQICYFRVRDKEEVAPEYLFYWFQSQQFWDQARYLKGATDMADYINLADIRSLNIGIPASPGRREVYARLRAIESCAQQNLAESARLTELRDALLPELLSGRIGATKT